MKRTLLRSGMILGKRTRTAAFALVMVGTYLNWATTLLWSVLGAARSRPIAGAGFGAPRSARAGSWAFSSW